MEREAGVSGSKLPSTLDADASHKTLYNLAGMRNKGMPLSVHRRSQDKDERLRRLITQADEKQKIGEQNSSNTLLGVNLKSYKESMESSQKPLNFLFRSDENKMKAVYSNASLGGMGAGGSALQRLKQDYDIDLSNYYSLSNNERLKLLSRKRAITL